VPRANRYFMPVTWLGPTPTPTMPKWDRTSPTGIHDDSSWPNGTFLAEGMVEGERSDLTGGGLVASLGGWQEVRAAKETGVLCKK
jgi:hypothetical protein